jgi:hypothetical protein
MGVFAVTPVVIAARFIAVFVVILGVSVPEYVVFSDSMRRWRRRVIAATRAPSTILRSLRELWMVPLPHFRGGG